MNKLTDRDKRALTILAVFVIVVCVGYWGVLPKLISADNYKEKIESLEEQKRIDDKKISQLKQIENSNAELKDKINQAEKRFLRASDNKRVDATLTGTIEANGLEVEITDINIGVKENADLKAYRYSDIFISGKSTAKETAIDLAAKKIDESGVLVFNEDITQKSSENNTVSATAVIVKLSGKKKDIEKFISILGQCYGSILVEKFSWEDNQALVSLKILMCED